FFQTVADFQRLHSRCESLEEILIYRPLDIDAVRGDARLAGIARFGGERALDRAAEVNVVENQHWRIAAQLERQGFDGLSRARDQNPADFGRSGESNFAAERVLQELLADLRRVAEHDLEDAFRQSGGGHAFG